MNCHTVRVPGEAGTEVRHLLVDLGPDGALAVPGSG